MSEAAVHFAIDRMDAEVAASALRAARLHPRVIPDDTSSRFGAAGVASPGRWIVYVPIREEQRARDVLDEPVREESEDRPLLRLALIVVFITALLLTTPFVAQICYGPLSP